MTQEKDLTVHVLSELSYPDQGKPCKHNRKNWYSINCMQHNYKHKVGQGCYKCKKHWFFEPDWRSEECRNADEPQKIPS